MSSKLPSDSSSTEWVERARAGEAEACRELYARVQTKVVPRLQMPRHMDSDEIVADTVSEVWQALKRLRDDQKVLTYATTIARRLASKKLKEKKRFAPLTQEVGDSHPVHPDGDPAERNAEREELYSTLSGSLKSADEKLFRLLYVTGASHPEVQDELGVDAPNLRKRRHRLHLKLREAVDRYGV